MMRRGHKQLTHVLSVPLIHALVAAWTAFAASVAVIMSVNKKERL